jgi:hypothetical protein
VLGYLVNYDCNGLQQHRIFFLLPLPDYYDNWRTLFDGRRQISNSQFGGPMPAHSSHTCDGTNSFSLPIHPANYIAHQCKMMLFVRCICFLGHCQMNIYRLIKPSFWFGTPNTRTTTTMRACLGPVQSNLVLIPISFQAFTAFT